MTTSRREFVQLSALAGGALAVGLAGRGSAGEEKDGAARKPLKILVLGGTGLIGPPLVRYATARGHEVTLFNRGKTNTHLFPDLEKLQGDRNGELGAIEAEVKKGRKWDAVVDNSASIPRWVEGSAGLLKESADLYLYTSSLSAYGQIQEIGIDETVPVATMTAEEVAGVLTPKDITGLNYGPLKGLCEAAARSAFPGRAIVSRPGLIVGPGDYTDRFTYWPVRIRKGGEVMAPGEPNDPVQFVDCRDLGEWYVRLIENQAIDSYNAVGPASRMGIAEMLYGIRGVVGGDVSFTWVDSAFLAEHGVQPWMHMTVWIPPGTEDSGLSQVDTQKAKAAGLTFRPLYRTVLDTLDYWDGLPEERRASPKAGCPEDLEGKTLAAWHARG
jgi:2'-hydroxyisoflavone reductase